MNEKRVGQNFTPRFYECDVLRAMESGQLRRAFLLWHRGAGKDKTCFVFMSERAARARVGNYWYWFPELEQARKSAWNNLDAQGFRMIHHVPEALVRRQVEDEMLIELVNDSTVQFMGGDHVRRIDAQRGGNPVGAVLSEYARMNPYVEQVIVPRLRLNGGWMIVNTTPAGPNHGKKLWDMACRSPAWFTQKLTVEDTGALTPAQLEEERAELRGRGWPDAEIEEYIQREYYCSFAAPVRGTIYGHLIVQAEREGRIGRVPHNPGQPVHTAWDLGLRDATAIWFLQRGRAGALHAIHYISGTGAGLPYWIRRCRELAAERGWVFGRHVAPHDIAQRDYSVGEEARKRIEVAADLGFEFTVAPDMGLLDGIDAVRRLIPRMWFDEQGCAEGLDALRSYHYKEDQARRVLSTYPEHDWASDGADALRMWAVTDPGDAAAWRKPEPLAGIVIGGREQGWMGI